MDEAPRWSWRLPNGGRVTAEIDPVSNVEYVRVAGKVASESARGGKPEGHVVDVPPREEDGETLTVTLTFDPKNAICILRVGREEIAPAEWPAAKPKKVERAPPPSTVSPWPLVAGALLILVGVILWFAFRGPSRDPVEEQPTTYRAPSGLFVAHHPASMKVAPVTLPTPFSGVLGTSPDGAAAIVLAAAKIDANVPRDPWLLQKQYLPEVLPHLPRGGGKLEETERRDDTCLGQRGAVIRGTLTNASGQTSKLWSCTFTRDDVAYLVLHVHPEPASNADERKLRTIVDATELTRLADLSETP